MLFETVRPGTLSRGLTMQLLLGNAIEILLLLQAGVELDSDELSTLNDAAKKLAGGVSFDQAVQSSAIADDSVEMVTAARAAFGPDTTTPLGEKLKTLSDALWTVANSNGNLENSSVPTDELLERLSALRDTLAARSAVAPDEVRGLDLNI